jgi:hypothetical protein
MISVMMLLVVSTVFAMVVVLCSTITDTCPRATCRWHRCGRALCFVAGDLTDRAYIPTFSHWIIAAEHDAVFVGRQRRTTRPPASAHGPGVRFDGQAVMQGHISHIPKFCTGGLKGRSRIQPSAR